jgi:hypothetical protein
MWPVWKTVAVFGVPPVDSSLSAAKVAIAAKHPKI